MKLSYTQGFMSGMSFTLFIAFLVYGNLNALGSSAFIALLFILTIVFENRGKKNE